MPFRVALCDNIDSDVSRLIEASGGLQIVEDPRVAQAVLIRSATKLLTRKAFDAWPEVLQVVRVGVGMDNVRKKIAGSVGTIVFPTPGASTEAVAVRSLLLILASAAKIVQSTNSLRRREWPKGKEGFRPENMKNKTLGIIGGRGRIGRRLEELARPFFGRIVISDIYNSGDKPNQVSLEELLAVSDVISLNASLPVDEDTGESKPILTEEHFKKMKRNIVFVNAARGEAIDRTALRTQMRDAGLRPAFDVYPVSPGKREGKEMFDAELCEILDHPYFVGTPHTAADDPDTQEELGLEAAQATIAFAKTAEINPKSVPDSNMLHVKIADPSDPVCRFLIMHPSFKGTIGTVATLIANHGGDILEFENNSRGIRFGDGNQRTLAVSMFDVAGIPERDAWKTLEVLRQRIEVLKARILVFGNT